MREDEARIGPVVAHAVACGGYIPLIIALNQSFLCESVSYTVDIQCNHLILLPACHTLPHKNMHDPSTRCKREAYSSAVEAVFARPEADARNILISKTTPSSFPSLASWGKMKSVPKTGKTRKTGKTAVLGQEGSLVFCIFDKMGKTENVFMKTNSILRRTFMLCFKILKEVLGQLKKSSKDIYSYY